MATIITVITRGSVFKYKCDRGFRMHGSSLLTCAGCAGRWCWWSSSYLIHIIPKDQKKIYSIIINLKIVFTNISLRRPWLGSVKASFVCKWDEIDFLSNSPFFCRTYHLPRHDHHHSYQHHRCIMTRAWLRRDSSLSSSLWTSQAKSKGSCLCFQVCWWDIGCDIENMVLMIVIGAFLGWWNQLLRMFLLQVQRWLNNGGEQHCGLRWPQLELLGADLSK